MEGEKIRKKLTKQEILDRNRKKQCQKSSKREFKENPLDTDDAIGKERKGIFRNK